VYADNACAALAPRLTSLQDYCRRLKMKCVKSGDEPCVRCKGAKKICTFGVEVKAKTQSGTQSIDK
jgi:hypothetical protein